MAVCCHGHGEAHSLSVSTSLSFFPRECAEAFKELCNTRNKGTEEPCNAVRTRAEGVCRSLKNICTVNARMGST